MQALRERLGIVTGLTAEARIAAPLGRVAAGGGTPQGARAAAERLVADGAGALLSFGLCGGLRPGLGAGAMVIAEGVVSLDPSPCGSGLGEGWGTDPSLNALIGGCTARALLAAERIAVTAAEKSALFSATGAEAVDLESGAVAAVAARHGLPFAVLRAVCDPAAFSLPPVALLALDAGGAIRPGRVAASLLARPGQLPALIALARAAAKARAALVRRVAEIVGRG